MQSGNFLNTEFWTAGDAPPPRGGQPLHVGKTHGENVEMDPLFRVICPVPSIPAAPAPAEEALASQDRLAAL